MQVVLSFFFFFKHEVCRLADFNRNKTSGHDLSPVLTIVLIITTAFLFYVVDVFWFVQSSVFYRTILIPSHLHVTHQ